MHQTPKYICISSYSLQLFPSLTWISNRVCTDLFSQIIMAMYRLESSGKKMVSKFWFTIVLNSLQEIVEPLAKQKKATVHEICRTLHLASKIFWETDQGKKDSHKVSEGNNSIQHKHFTAIQRLWGYRVQHSWAKATALFSATLRSNVLHATEASWAQVHAWNFGFAVGSKNPNQRWLARATTYC